MKPIISVIVAVYKAEQYIHKCINSLFSQSFKDFEILLIDDGSPDSSGKICDEYAKQDSRIRVFHKINGGVSSARQCGIDNALGEYSIHIDPDDWVESRMLEELYDKAKKENADMVICDFFEDNIRTNKSKYIKQKPSQLDNKTVLNELFLHLHGSCCNKLVKLECYNKYNIKFPLELSFCEDQYVNAALLKNNIKISYLPKAYYHYCHYINTNSLSFYYTKTSFFHDEMKKKLFLDLLKNESCIKTCKYCLESNIVYRAYYGNIFSSTEFKQKLFKYRNSIFQNNSYTLLTKYKLYLSCVGLYQLIYKLQQYVDYHKSN